MKPSPVKLAGGDAPAPFSITECELEDMEWRLGLEHFFHPTRHLYVVVKRRGIFAEVVRSFETMASMGVWMRKQCNG